MILTAYLDESGTHDGSPVTVMGGMLANARQWEAFEKGFGKLKAVHGFQIFYTQTVCPFGRKGQTWSAPRPVLPTPGRRKGRLPACYAWQPPFTIRFGQHPLAVRETLDLH